MMLKASLNIGMLQDVAASLYQHDLNIGMLQDDVASFSEHRHASG